jgi:predicted PurR-regulated permease PerM
MQKLFTNNLTSSLVKALVFAIGIVVFICFMRTVISAVLLFLLAIVFAVIINAPVSWLEKKKIPRAWATFLVFFLVFLVFGLFSWLIIPIASAQLKNLILNLPVYVGKIEKMLSSWRAEYFHWMKPPAHPDEIDPNLPSMTNALWKLGGYSISFVESILLFLVLVSLTAYMVIYPRPLLRFYLFLFPLQHRDNAQNAFIKTSFMVIGWMRSNLIGGVIEGACTVVFLNIMNVPGAWVWGLLTLLSQMIPRIGFYLMSVPPALVALSMSPLTALWVFVFFIVLDEILDDLIMPRLRSSWMNLHPVAIMFSLLVMGAAFGFAGIILSTPIAAFLKCFYEEFYLTRLQPDLKIEQRVETMIKPSGTKKKN